MRTTHVGSLVRPDELVAYLRKRDAGEAYDEQAYLECLARSVREVVAKQRDAGIDIVSDGEYGKSAWNYYVYERLGGIELRPHPVQHADFASVNDAPTDWTRFPEFYAAVLRHRAGVRGPGRRLGVRGEGHLHGRRGDPARHRQPQGRDGGGGRRGGLPAGRRACELLPEPDRRALRLRGGRAAGHRRGAARGVQGDRRRRPLRPDRRRLHPVHVRRDRPARHDGRLPRLGAAAHRRRQPRARGDPVRSRPLPRLLGLLERAAHERHRAARRAAARLPGQRRHLPLRARQPAPRARVARLGGRRGARRASCWRRA